MYNVQRGIVLLLMAMSISLSAQDFSADRELFDAYQREDMSVWKTYIDKVQGDKVQGTKVIENGVLYLKYNGAKYNVQGMKVNW